MDIETRLNQQIALFYFAYKSFTNSSDTLIEKHGLTRLHHRILFFIARMPGVTTGEMITILEISKQALQKPITELREKGLIHVGIGEHDKRKRALFLTSAGIRLTHELDKMQRKQLSEVFKEAGDPEGKVFTAVLKEFAKQRAGTEFIQHF
ncbi:MarR family transcriptional regulator [Listeria fleischmannii 1991]|jgi:DNA-binding MarR family transcriptional regulator|uniref:MarR family n=4 Tax=Listeria fleischmannii TaxID=1069827 RepID=A0A2X3GQX2_9LIST|nr:helix-turn-helix domain-containing protein [Listeria fleischmannii]EIA21563.1 hypothetical protein KKC_00292 [Listeria fleischmannii subsp. coloradonensis]EMG27546.1 transcriptional regulator [Listeria fleischmannii subsp. fleischmannii LU2006-1]EUJ52448.1 MarR family transcriptional regulator [Listeria fleischmannii FSL S10-1203]KMT59210.1 MarR family transcriptional regulator [Listeria fleischmannii 1991]MBC1398761.1 MarR family transcriptional regulator [Listeria fleischmannii]